MSSSVCVDINGDYAYFKMLSDYFDKHSYKYVKTYATQISSLEIMQKLCCNQKENHIILNYSYFKYIIKTQLYSWDEIIQYIVNVKRSVLKNYSHFTIHMNINDLTLMDIDKYYLFIQKISQIMKDEFPEKMNICHIYNAPYIFSKLFSIVSVLIDKDTQKKIKLMDVD
jgi:hypothetical protein